VPALTDQADDTRDIQELVMFGSSMDNSSTPARAPFSAGLALIEAAPVAADGAGAAEEFFLPELPRLLPFAYHPRAAQIEFQSNDWVCRFLGACFASEQALLAFLRQRNGFYGPLTVPAADQERARNIADFYHFVTVVDDATADRSASGVGHHQVRAAFDRIMTGFGTDPDSDSDTGEDFPYGRAAADLWRRISPALTPAQAMRFRASLHNFLRGAACELPYRLTGTAPDLDTYLALRGDSFGFDFMLLLTEYALAVDMTEVTTAPEFAVLHTHAVRQLILVNDVLSWRREYALHDSINAVRVLCRHDGLTLQQAVDALCRLIEQHERAYIAARDAIRQDPLGTDADVLAYLDGLDHLIGGSQEFEYLTPRYFGDGYVWDGTTSGWLSLTAPVARFRPQPADQGRAHGSRPDAAPSPREEAAQ